MAALAHLQQVLAIGSAEDVTALQLDTKRFVEAESQQSTPNTSRHNLSPVVTATATSTFLHEHRTPVHAEFRTIAQFVNLRRLSLSGVGIGTLVGFPRLPHLTKLNLSHNNLVSVEEFRALRLMRLSQLDLRFNQLEDFESLEVLQCLPSLLTLKLDGCPIAKTESYHEMVFSMLPSLELLDNQDGNGDEVEELGDEDDDDDEDEDETSDVGTDDNEDDEDEDEVDDDEVIRRVHGMKGAGKGKMGSSSGRGKISGKYSGKGITNRLSVPAPVTGKFPGKGRGKGKGKQPTTHSSGVDEYDGDGEEEDEEITHDIDSAGRASDNYEGEDYDAEAEGDVDEAYDEYDGDEAAEEVEQAGGSEYDEEEEEEYEEDDGELGEDEDYDEEEEPGDGQEGNVADDQFSPNMSLYGHNSGLRQPQYDDEMDNEQEDVLFTQINSFVQDPTLKRKRTLDPGSSSDDGDEEQ